MLISKLVTLASKIMWLAAVILILNFSSPVDVTKYTPNISAQIFGFVGSVIENL